MPILGCKMPILELIKLASHGAKRKAKWCKTHPNAQIWIEQNGHKSTIQPLNVWFKTAIRARMERRKRAFCKIYLPKLGYPKNLPTNFPLPPYCLPSYYLPHYHLLLITLLLTTILLATILLTPYPSTTYNLITYYLLLYFLLLTTILLTALLLTPYPSTTYNLITYYLLPYFLLLTTILLTTLLLTTLLPTPLQHVLLFFDTQLCFATLKWGVNPKFIITLPSTSVHERSVYLGFASQRYHTPLNFRPAPHIAFGALTKYKGKYNLAKSSKQGTSSNGRTSKPYDLKTKEKR